MTFASVLKFFSPTLAVIVQYWKVITLGVALSACTVKTVLYVRDAEKAKTEAAVAKDRARVALANIAPLEKQNTLAKAAIDSLTKRRTDDSLRYAVTLSKMGNTKIRVIHDLNVHDSNAVPVDSGDVDEDNIQTLLSEPLVQELILEHSKDRATWDSTSRVKDGIIANDANIIRDLKAVAVVPPTPKTTPVAIPVIARSRFERIATGVAAGAAGAIAGQQIGGRRGIAITVGGTFGLLAALIR